VSRHTLADDDATADLGRRIAAVLRPGDLVALVGDLGAGKTAIARTIVRTLAGDVRLEVPSPTFALVQPYDGVIHADLYRIRDAREIDELGLFDRPEAIVLVEWPERAPELLATATVRIALSIPAGGSGRVAEVTFADGRSV
jgi:tRNA threonylcarbamoyl adenosine modification protein YjeE